MNRMNNIYLTFDLLFYYNLIVEEYFMHYSSIKEQAFTINFLNNEVSSMNDILFKSMVKTGIIEILGLPMSRAFNFLNIFSAVPSSLSSIQAAFLFPLHFQPDCPVNFSNPESSSLFCSLLNALNENGIAFGLFNVASSSFASLRR